MNIPHLEEELAEHPDRGFVSELITGFGKGFITGIIPFMYCAALSLYNGGGRDFYVTIAADKSASLLFCQCIQTTKLNMSPLSLQQHYPLILKELFDVN